MRTNIVLDDDLVNEAVKLTGGRTIVNLALNELIRNRKKKDLFRLPGSLKLRDDFDHKALRDTRFDSD